MNDLSFDIKTTGDFYHKLFDDYCDFINNRTSSRIALNCAMTAWHLTDWTFNEFRQQLSNKFNSLSQFQNDIKQKCPSLQLMHDLANGSKHYFLTRHNPIVKETNLHKGSFSSDFSRDFDISSLIIELKDGSKIYFEDELEKVMFFWREFLETNFNLNL